MKDVEWIDGFGKEQTTAVVIGPSVDRFTGDEYIVTRNPVSREFVLVRVECETATSFCGSPVDK